uniref:CCHC-type domain-containing protein n=1 Tax=Brassica oleracea var. oleracea TaxID=109376 RepID=A0A0D3E7C7_BRAOL
MRVHVIPHDLFRPILQKIQSRKDPDVPRFVDQSIGANQHGDQDVLNNLTEFLSSDRTGHTDRAVMRASRLELQLEPRPGGVVEEKPCWLKRNPALGQMFGLLKKSKPQQDVYFPFKTVFEKEQLIFDKKQFASNGFDFVQKQRKRQNICDDENKAVKPTSKAHSTRCFKCHRIGHYANKCQKQKPLVTLENENLETEPEKEDPLPIHKPDQTQANQHGDQDVLNNLTEVRSSVRTGHTDRAIMRASRLELRLEPRPDDRTTARLPRPTRHSKTHGRARLSLGREETKDGHAFSSGGPSGQSCKRPYRYPVHPSGSDEPGRLD